MTAEKDHRMQTHCYDEFDAFAESVGHVDSRMLYRNPERRVWRLTSVDLGGLSIQHGELGSGNIAQGQMQTHGCMIYAPLTPDTEYVANGTTMAADSFTVLNPGSEFCFCTKASHDWATIFLPNDLLATLDDLDEHRNGTPTVRVTPANRWAADRFREALRNIMTAAAASPAFASSPAAHDAAAELQEIASTVLGRQRAEPPTTGGRPKVSRDEVIRRCHELLEQSGGWPVRIDELAAAAQVRPRTLQRIFQEYFGIGPKRYLQLRQLHQVRRALRGAEPDAESVTDVLVKSGVWEFGRFAARYRRMFGELPSATLRAQHRVMV